MLYFCLALLFSLQLPLSAKFNVIKKNHPIEVARQFLGQKEATGNNDGVAVEFCLNTVGLGKGYSYCAAFVSTGIKYSNSTYKPLSAVAQKFIIKSSVKARDVINGKVIIDSNYVAIWKRGSTPYGHIGFIEKWDKLSGHTIEGNTSSGTKGNQYNGDGFFRRVRKIEPYNYFRITHFTKIM